MTSPDPDIEPLIDALRDDLPEPKEAERLRARLTAAGIIAGGVVAAPSTAAGTQGSPRWAAQPPGGVVSKAAAMFGGSKVLLAAVVLAGSALPVTAYLASSSTEKAESRAVARDRRGLGAAGRAAGSDLLRASNRRDGRASRHDAVGARARSPRSENRRDR